MTRVIIFLFLLVATVIAMLIKYQAGHKYDFVEIKKWSRDPILNQLNSSIESCTLQIRSLDPYGSIFGGRVNAILAQLRTSGSRLLLYRPGSRRVMQSCSPELLRLLAKFANSSIKDATRTVTKKSVSNAIASNEKWRLENYIEGALLARNLVAELLRIQFDHGS